MLSLHARLMRAELRGSPREGYFIPCHLAGSVLCTGFPTLFPERQSRGARGSMATRPPPSMGLTPNLTRLIGPPPREPTLADAILDRLVHNAHKLNLKGESMRKNNTNLTTDTTNQ